MITIKHGPWGASHKSVTAQRTREDGLSLTKEGYIATCRFGSQQSCTRLFLKPTQMTDSLARKNVMGHTISTGYESPVHSPSTCPKEALVRITKAEDGGIGAQLPEHDTWFFYLPRICNHCSYPACLVACPRKAIYKRPEDGIVLIDQKKCRGYRKCVEGCPYKKSMYRSTTKISEKCIACYPRIEGKDPESNGQPMETRCMVACVGKIRLQGLVKMGEEGWAEDPQNPLYYLVHEEKIALPLYPQLGTEPNIYYIPPRWVRRGYLKQMFGPGVEEAIQRYSYPSRKLLAVLQLFRTTRTIIFRFDIKKGEKVTEVSRDGKTIEIYNDTVIGYDSAGKEVVQVPVQHPLIQRPAGKHFNVT